MAVSHYRALTGFNNAYSIQPDRRFNKQTLRASSTARTARVLSARLSYLLHACLDLHLLGAQVRGGDSAGLE